MFVNEVLIQSIKAIEADFESRSSDRKGYGNVYVGSSKTDVVENFANGTKILTSSGSDFVTSVAGGVVIDSGDDDDYIISIGMGNEIHSGAGNDQIYSQYSRNHINKGTGSDVVYVTAKYGITGLDEKEDDVADIIMTPGFSYQYIKNSPLMYDPYYIDNSSKEEEKEGNKDKTKNTY